MHQIRPILLLIVARILISKRQEKWHRFFRSPFIFALILGKGSNKNRASDPNSSKGSCEFVYDMSNQTKMS